MRFEAVRAACLHVTVSSCLILAACTAPPHRPDPGPALPAPAPAPDVTTVPTPAETGDAAPAQPDGHSPWPRIRSRFVLENCDYDSAVQKEASNYTRNSRAFTSSLADAMPLLLFVVGELERRDLPGEFALLPYVESRYQVLPARGREPAGIWQLIGRTAVGQGLQVDKSVDQRLDVVASTRVALDLIERYDREFGDWRVATMAFNAGEFRLKQQLGTRSPAAMDARELGSLKLSPTTHQHLRRLLALACIVEQPGKFGIILPDPAAEDVLSHLQLDPPIDLRLAANLLGMPFDALHQFNAAPRVAPGKMAPVSDLLFPAARTAEFETNLGQIPEERRTSWQELRVKPGDTLDSLAAAGNTSVQVLAAANGLSEDAAIGAGNRLLVPGAVTVHGSAPDTYVVKRGDTLSAIARRHGVKLAQLLRWNNLEKGSILHLDMQLQVRAPQY